MNEFQIVFQTIDEDSYIVDDYKGTGNILVYVHDYAVAKSENCVSDFTPDWLYDILNKNAPSYVEECESLFGMSIDDLKKLIPLAKSVVIGDELNNCIGKELSPQEIQEQIDSWK